MGTVEVTPNKSDAPIPGITTQPDRRQPSFVRDHFAVLIVFAVFVLLLGVYIMEIHWSGNDAIIGWLQNKMSDLIAAMLMGLTGAGIKTVVNGKP
jgi:hypothetical protein